MFRTLAMIFTAIAASSVVVAEPPQPAATPNGRIMVLKEGKYITLTPEGKQLEEFTPKLGKRTIQFGKAKAKEISIADQYVLLMPDGKRMEIPWPEKVRLAQPCFAPDGKRVAFIEYQYPAAVDREGNNLRKVFVRNLDKNGEGITFDIVAQNLVWIAEGKLLVVEVLSHKDLMARKFKNWVVDMKTQTKTQFEFPEGVQIIAATPDGKSFLAKTYDEEKKEYHLATTSRDGKQIRTFADTNSDPILSPDGSRILFRKADRMKTIPVGAIPFWRLYTYDLKTQTGARLADVPLNAFIGEIAWSPDSKKVAYIWKRVDPGAAVGVIKDENGMSVPIGLDGKPVDISKLLAETETFLNVADADGKNSRTILAAKANSINIALTQLAWR